MFGLTNYLKHFNIPSMQKYVLLLASLMSLLCVSYAFGQCNLSNPLTELSWIQEQIDADFSDGVAFCTCDYEVRYGCFQGDAVFIFGRGANSNCADFEAQVYDAQGTLLCVDGGITGGDCFGLYPALFEELGNASVIWDCESIGCALNIKAFLQGALLSTTDGLMRDDLRQKNELPTQEPYTALANFTHVGSGGGETIETGVFDVTGNDAIVDWVLVEWRSDVNPTNVVQTASALIQRDGDVVGMDGESLLDCGFSSGRYFISLRHRNHLGVMTNNPIDFSESIIHNIYFSDGSMETWGIDAQVRVGNINALWGGNASIDNEVSFQGPNNDSGGIFFEVLTTTDNSSFAANYIYEGYHVGDIDLNGETIYQGANSDANHVFFEILFHPENPFFLANYIIYEQLP